MSLKYDWAYTVLAHHEGGFVDNSNDPGGVTNFGVSIRFLRQNGIDIDGDGDIDEKDIRAITAEKSKEIYKEYFWNPCRCDSVRSELISTKLFDMAVNMGQKQAYKLVQRAINNLNYSPQLVVDGQVGPATLKAINSFEKTDYELIRAIRVEQADFYDDLILKKPRLREFRLGWQRRAAA